jgi:hypothetical protein
MGQMSVQAPERPDRTQNYPELTHETTLPALDSAFLWDFFGVLLGILEPDL